MVSDCLKKNKQVGTSIAVYLLFSLRPHRYKSSRRKWQDVNTVWTPSRKKAENTAFWYTHQFEWKAEHYLWDVLETIHCTEKR